MTVAQSLQGWDAVELWVGSARATAGWFMSGFGFRCVAYAGPETGVRDRVSYVLEQGDVRFVVTGALHAGSPIAAHVLRHGDGVKELAWRVEDVPAVFDEALRRGATAVTEPWVDEDDVGKLTRARIAAYGETVHTIVDRTLYAGSYAPGYTADDLLPDPPGPEVGLRAIDHIVGNVEEGRLQQWVDAYKRLGFSELVHFDEHQIATEYSALRSTVVWNGGSVVMPVNEPAPGRRKSQIQEYVEAYDGPGVQHVALATDDIVRAVSALRQRGIRFMRVPDTYYDEARERLAGVDLPWDDLRRLQVLVDRDDHGHLLQIFTETVTDRPALFVEIIERRGARGFGEGNFKALFEAIERDQARRGNL